MAASHEETDPKTAKKLLQEFTKRCSAEKAPFWFSRRFYVVLLLFYNNLNVTFLTINLNIVIVEMTSKEKIIAGKLVTYEPEFAWDSKVKGLIQSAYACGYIFWGVGVPMVNKFGGSVTVGISTMALAIINLITPACLYINFWLFVVSRTVLGVLDSVCSMTILEIISRWLPVSERSTKVSFCMCGIYIGVAITYPIFGFIANRWGWRTVFYFSGLEGIIFSSIFLLVVKNEPSKDRWMSKELSYLLENTKTTSRKQVVHPYKKIFTSMAVWALCVSKFTSSWGIALLVACFPLYVKDMSGRSTDEVGLISSIPHFSCFLATLLSGFIIDYWQNNSSLTITQIHKIIMSMAFISCSIFFVIASYSTNFTLSIVCFIFIKSIIAFISLILQLLCLYMSPTHCSILSGISLFGYKVSGIVIPNIVGLMMQNHSLEEWSRCFLLSAAVLFAGAIMFLLYGSSKLQSWDTMAPAVSVTSANGSCRIENKTDCEA